MQRIQLLDKQTINKIAAGEVVESPKSVVKELTENAMDAGASTITVEIRDGGISYIRITDNGCGIPKEQVKEAFLRHATSKLTQIEDLEHIYTMGFRGEALASIAAVAQVEMLTKTKDETIGTKIEIEGGEVKNIQDAACTDGTTVIVKNLFYNVPARRKFLKKPAKESGYVADLMNQLALGHAEISFCYINNDTTILQTSGNGDGKAAIFYVYGKEAAKSMLEISYAKGGYRLTGWIGKPELSRGNRNYENLYINGRYIKNKIVSSAVEEAYKTRIMIGKFPVYVLHLEVDAAQVDVNVHPAKLEVRFQDENAIFDFFYDAVCQTLEKEVLIPQASWDKQPTLRMQPAQVDKTSQQTNEPELSVTTPKSVIEQMQLQTQQKEPDFAIDGDGTTEEKQNKSVDQLLKNTNTPSLRVQQTAVPLQSATVLDDFIVEETKKEAKNEIQSETKNKVSQQKESKKEPFFHNYKIIGQLFRTYWMVEQGDSVYLIDQHAAHERILYEKLMQQFQNAQIVSQRLLTPLMLHLTQSETQILQENQELLENFGFGLEQFPGGIYGLQSVPVLLKEPSGVGFFTEILDALTEGRVRDVYDTKILAVATMACKAAVKAHDKLSIQEAQALIVQLLELENPFTCPHGRPTIVALSRYELEKKFKRIQN